MLTIFQSDSEQYIDRALARLEALETFEEILSVLSPKQIVIIALRFDGLGDQEIADLLNMSRQAVGARVAHGKKVIKRELPELAPKIEGRVWDNVMFRGKDADT